MNKNNLFKIINIKELTDVKTPYGWVKPILKNFYLSTTPDFTVGISSLNSGKSQELLHEFSDEIIICISGEFNIYVNNIQYNIHEEECVFIPKGQAYKIENKTNAEVKVIYIAFPLAPNPMLGHTYIEKG